MISNLVNSLVPELVPSIIDGVRGTFGVPFVTSDGLALFTIDDEVLLASSVTAMRSQHPSQPFVTSDGLALIDTDNQLLLGA